MSLLPLFLLTMLLACNVCLAVMLVVIEKTLTSKNQHQTLQKLNKQQVITSVRLFALRPDKFLGAILLLNLINLVIATTINTVVSFTLFGISGLLTSSIGIIIVFFMTITTLPKHINSRWTERITLISLKYLQKPIQYLAPIAQLLDKLTARLFQLTRRIRLWLYPLPTNLTPTSVNDQSTHKAALTYQLNKLEDLNEIEEMTVDEVMLPRGDIYGLDLTEDISNIIEKLQNLRYSKIPVFNGNIENVVGFFHQRHVMRLLRGESDQIRENIGNYLTEPYFVPLGTPLLKQLINFRHQRERLSLVVDEYGEIHGLLTLEDTQAALINLLFTERHTQSSIAREESTKGSFLIDGSANIRELNRAMGWELPTDGPRTINGLILETLENIPEAGTSFKIASYTFEIVFSTDSVVKTVRVIPPLPVIQH